MGGRLYDMEIARRINSAHGGAVIAEWNVRELDDETIHLYTELSRVKSARAVAAGVEDTKAKWRAQFQIH